MITVIAHANGIPSVSWPCLFQVWIWNKPSILLPRHHVSDVIIFISFIHVNWYMVYYYNSMLHLLHKITFNLCAHMCDEQVQRK